MLRMKRNWILCGTLAGLLVPTWAMAKDLRIGVVDMQRAVSETDEGKAAESRLMGVKKKLEDELNRKIKELQEEDATLRKSSAILKDEEKRRRIGDLQKKFDSLQKRYMDAERELMQKKTDAMMKISKKLNKIIQVVAEKDKYDFIFNGAAVLWAPRYVDITNEVIRRYNQK